MKILLALLAFTTFTSAQSTTILSNGIYTSASDFDAKILTHGFAKSNNDNKIRDMVTHHVYVKNNDSSFTYDYGKIWGFRKDNDDWRITNDKLYKVVYTGKAYVYIRPTRKDNSQPNLTKFETTWFSVTADGPLYQLTKENLLTAYSNNASLVKKVSAMKDNAIVDKKNKATGEYEFISWLN